MRRFEAQAILLDVSDLQEGDRIVTFLTREHGCKRGAARGARRRYSRFAGQLQPLARVGVTWFEKEGRDLVRISEIELERPADSLTTGLESVLVGSYLSEHMSLFAQENEDCERLYRLLEAVTEAMVAGVDPLLCARYYELWMLRLAGLLDPALVCPLCERDLGGRAILPDEGETLLCEGCAAGSAGRRVGPGALGLIEIFGRTGPGSLPSSTGAGPALRELQIVCAEIRRRFLGHELRSYQVLERTLAEVGSAVGGSEGDAEKAG